MLVVKAEDGGEPKEGVPFFHGVCVVGGRRRGAGGRVDRFGLSSRSAALAGGGYGCCGVGVGEVGRRRRRYEILADEDGPSAFVRAVDPILGICGGGAPLVECAPVTAAVVACDHYFARHSK